MGLAYGLASQTHREMMHATNQAHLTPEQFTNSAGAATALVVALASYWIVNNLLINAIVILSTGSNAFRSFFHDRDGLVVDVVAACIGTLAAIVWSA